MTEVYQQDIKILLWIFAAYVVACVVVIYLNSRRVRGDECALCGGEEFPVLHPGPGLISGRLMLRCEECGRERQP